jgi:sugar lactone lactonase YvrE
MRVEQATGPVTYHGEGPVWSRRWGGLRWVDMLAGDVLSLADDGTVARRHVGSVVAALRPRREGGAVLALERVFALEEPDGSIASLPELWGGTDVRMNEGGCDRTAASTAGRWPTTNDPAQPRSTGSMPTWPCRRCSPA